MHCTACATVIGREHELNILNETISAVAEGRGGTAWIEGAAGTGKSALIDAVLEQALAQGVTVLRATADELAAAFPLRMMADCLDVSRRSADPDRAALAQALSEPPVVARTASAASGGDPDGDPGAGPRANLATRMLDVAWNTARQGPVLIAGDDLQWADEASLTLWLRLTGLTSQVPLLLLGAARTGPGHAPASALAECVRRHSGPVISLAPLEPDAAAGLAERSLGAPPGPRLLTELQRAGGNPQYMHDLIGALADAGLIEVTGEIAEFRGEAGVTPPPLAASVERSIGHLSDQARGTVRIAALFGDGCTVADLSVVAGRPAQGVALDLAEAGAAELLARDGDRVRFRQPLVRQALASQIPSAVSPALHQHAARSLAANGRRLASVAPHLLAGPATMEDWALRWLALRSDSSLYQVPQAAVELLESAVQLVDQDDPRWEAFAGKLAQASFWLGRDDGVLPVALEVARRTSDVGLACRMTIFAMRSAARAGSFAEGIAAGETALRDKTLPDVWQARLGAWLAVLLLQSGQAQRGEAKAFDALRHAALAGDPIAIASAHQAAAYGSGTEAAVAHADTALAALGSDTESADLRLFLLRNRLIWLVRLDTAEELEETLTVALREAERSGTFRSVGIRGAAAHVRYRQGRWEEALAQLEQIDPAFRAHGHAVRLRALASLIALHRGQQAEAAGHLAAAGGAAQRAPDSMEPGGGHLVIARALAAEAEGDLPRAAEAVADWLAVPGTLRRHLACDDAPDLVRLAFAAGEPDLARAVVRALEADAAADPAPGPMLAARCGRAQADGDPAALTAVAADYQRYGWPVRQGLALEEAAVRYAEAGQHTEARAALTEAAQAYGGPGAAWDVRRADARLRQHGIRRGPRSAHRTQDTGWAALTPAEAQVALLAVDGLSNADIATRLFVSQRTVHAQISQILAKLQIRSRAELARAHAEQSPAGTGAPQA